MEEQPKQPVVTITFTLPDNQEELQDSLDGGKWKGVVWDIDSEFRNRIKHGDYKDDVYAMLEEMRNKLHEIIENYKLTLD